MLPVQLLRPAVCALGRAMVLLLRRLRGRPAHAATAASSKAKVVIMEQPGVQYKASNPKYVASPTAHAATRGGSRKAGPAADCACWGVALLQVAG